MRAFAAFAFSAAVRQTQAAWGGQSVARRLLDDPNERSGLDSRAVEMVGQARSFFLASCSQGGWPYVQHRGGPPGFVQVVGPQNLAFDDYEGNRQYITVGNLSENPQVHLIFIDFARQTRLKIWGRAQALDDASGSRRIEVSVLATDWNCRQHIPLLVRGDQMP